MKSIRNLMRFFISACLAAYFFMLPSWGEMTVSTVWGEHVIHQPILEKLIQHGVMQRLKSIDQSGPLFYFDAVPGFTRYDHSIGVLVLLQKAHAPLAEQVAGLLHDASHTAFSHIGDHLFFETNHAHSYQDTIHLTFLKRYAVDKDLSGYDLTLEALNPDCPQYTALERPLPDLCADRIQYILHTGVILKKISQKDAAHIVADLRFKDDTWFFKSSAYAMRFANLSLDFTKNFWGSPYNCACYGCFSDILKRAIALKVITADDIKFGKDMDIIKALKVCDDSFIQNGLKNMHRMRDMFKVMPFGKGRWNIKPKFRGVDPFVMTQQGLKRLSLLDPQFKKQFDSVRAWCETGYGVTIDGA